MRTELIQNNHHTVYENFYANHERVFSIPLCQNWCGDRDIHYEGINIKQKIPLRIYIGIKRNSEPGVLTFGKLMFYNHSNKKFELRKVSDHLPYVDELYEHIVNHLGLDREGYELNWLCEAPRGAGLGFDGIIIATASTACFSIQNADIEKEHKEIIKFGIELEEKLFYRHNNSYIGSGIMWGKYPTIVSKEGKLISIEKLSKIKIIPKIGIDQGLIYCGSPLASEQLSTKSLVINEYQNKFLKMSDEITDSELKQSLTLGINFDEGYQNAGSSISKELLFGLMSCYMHQQTDTDQGYLILSMNRYRYLQTIQKILSYSFSVMVNKLFNLITPKGLTPGLTYNDGSSSGGCVLFALPKEQLRSTLYEFLEDPKNVEAGICMIYSNREDGIETEGLKIEQDLSRGIYSKHIASHNYKLTKIGGECIIGDHNQLIKNSGLDIIFDKVGNKVYLMGQQTTSAQLFSQTATVELFDILIRHAKTRVTNKDLPPSAYSKSRNEMYGKIIGPFVHLVHEQCNKSLDLEMKGTGSQYSIKFGPGNLTFGIIEERGNVKKK